MSTRLLDHAWGLRGHRLQGTGFVEVPIADDTAKTGPKVIVFDVTYRHKEK